jgi:hypothetical protein
VNQRDPKGYYSALGISSTASLEEIKHAFRILAKECHPDKNSDPSAAARLKAISEGYAVLSDVDKRSKYDAEAYEAPDRSAKTAPLEPIHCSSCGKPTAQPRHAVYWTVVSLLIASWRTPSQGIYCATCAGRISLRCTAISAAFGWWGVWGLFWTPISIFSNANGGQRQQGSEARLLWYNALAFLSQGKLAVTHALARQVAATKSEHALDAADLLAELHRAGVPRDTPPLVDPWKKSSANSALQAALGLAVPAFVVAMIYFDGHPGPAFSAPAWASAPGAILPVSTSTATDGQVPTTTSPMPVAACAEVPADGEVIEGQVARAEFGHHIEINNGSDGPAIIKVRDANTGHVRVAFYVSKGGHAKVGPLPDGTYRIQYAFGPGLAEDCKSFTAIDSASEFPDAETLKKEYREDGAIAQRLSYTLYSVPNGNVRPAVIDRSKFLAE